MNDFSQLALIRRSHRKFTPESIEPEMLKTIVKTALMAPSGKGLHSYEFVTVTDPQTLGRLSRCKSAGGEMLATAPAAIVVMGNPETSDTWMEDASIAATMILLQAEDLGLGACWVQIRERKDEEGRLAEDNVRRLLGVPQEMRVLCIVALGHKGAERKPQNEERLKWDKVHTEKW